MDFHGKILNYKYKIDEKIFESGFSYVYSAYNRQENDKKVAIKIVKPEGITFRKEDLLRFRHEATAVSHIDHPNIVKIIEVGEFEGLNYLVMEPLEGTRLLSILTKLNHITIEQKVNIVAEIAEALITIHNHDIVHKELNPGNILVLDDINWKNIKIIDFAFAHIKDFSKIRDTEEIVGVFSYMSPEQSGIIKRNVDSRTDLYSLGIIFYQLLTGQLPYKGNDISSIMHKHIALLPEPPGEIDPLIPEALDKIVLKLLEKEPDRRYLNAQSLSNDLKKYLTGEKNILTGADEVSGKLRYFSDHFGRKNEYARLVEIFGGTLNGKGGICLISGEFGIGKTRLVEELVDNIYYHRGTFIEGKSFAGGNRTPYGAVRDALADYLKYFNEYPADKKQLISESIIRQIGGLGEIIVKFQPSMREILGDPAPVVKLLPNRETKRFLMTLSKLFLSLSEVEKGLVFILDNLQWLDDSSYVFLQEVAKNIANFPLLIIGLYRDNELTENHNVLNLISYLRENADPLEEIKLEPINSLQMNKYLANMLNQPVENTKELSDMIFNYSRGNPYFAAEILKQLYEEKAINTAGGKLAINAEAIEKLAISRTVIDVILKRTSLLNEKEKTILSYAAVMGGNFDLELLFKITKYPDEEVLGAVDKALELQLLKRNRSDSTILLFSHSRIAEKLLEGIKKEKKQMLHLTIARALEEIHKGAIDRALFEIAHHYTEGADKEKILEYAVPAVNQARENYANDEVIKITSMVRSILDEKGETGGGRWINCMEVLGQIYLTIGKSDESIEIFSALLKYIKTKPERAMAYQLMSQAFFIKGDWSSCELFGGVGLALLGETIPVNKFQVIASLAKELLSYAVRSIFRLNTGRDAAGRDSGTYKVIVNYYMTLNWMYILSDIVKFIRSVLRMLNISQKIIGKSREQGMSLAVFASLLMVISFFKKSIMYHELALEMRRDLNDYFGEGQSLQFIGYCYSYQGDYLRSIGYFLMSKEIFINIGDVWEIAMVMNGLGYNYFYLGNYDDSIKCFMEYHDISEKNNDYYGMSVAAANLSIAYSQKGDFDAAESHGKKALAFSKEKKIWYPHCFANINYGYLMMEKGNYEEAVYYFETAKKLYLENHFLKNYTVYLFSFLAEAYLEIYKIGQKGLRVKEIKKLCGESLSKARRWPNHYAAALRVNAKFYIMAGKPEAAERYFKKSIRHSAFLGRRHEIARGLYEYGIFLKERGKEDSAEIRLKAAHQIFKEIGAESYVHRTEQLLGLMQEEDLSSMKMMMDKQRIYSIIQVSQDISSIMNLDELIDKVMTVSIEVTGAQRGYLMISNEDTGRLEIAAWKNINEGNKGDRNEIIMAVAEEVYNTGKPKLIANAMEDELYSKIPETAEFGLKSILCIPLKHKDEVKGVCYLDNPLTASVFSKEDQDFLSIIMTQAAISIEIVRLYELGITDGLTKLVTHLHFQNLLQKEINKSIRYSRELSLIMIDIDHFKNINDTYGHQAGDEVLKSVSRIVKTNIRNIDTAARYGGDELVVVLPEIPLTGAEQIAERIREIVAGHGIQYDGKNLQVTVSLGVATFPGHANDRESLIKAADEALYVSKSSGKNMVTPSEARANKTAF